MTLHYSNPALDAELAYRREVLQASGRGHPQPGAAPLVPQPAAGALTAPAPVTSDRSCRRSVPRSTTCHAGTTRRWWAGPTSSPACWRTSTGPRRAGRSRRPARRRRRGRQDPAARRAHRPGRRARACGCSPGTASTSATSACPTCPSSTCCARWPPTPTLAPDAAANPVARRPARRPPRRRPPGAAGRARAATWAARCRTGPPRSRSTTAGCSCSSRSPALICELAAAGPLLIVLEDVHWADRSSRDLLRYLLARLVDEPVAVVASYRSDDLHRRHPLRPLLAELVRLPGVERLELAPLPTPRSARWSAAWPARPAAARATVDDVVARAEGNAFYAEELLAAGLHGEALPLGADRRPAGPGRAALPGRPAGAADRRRGRPARAARAGRRRRRAGRRRSWSRRWPRRCTTTCSWSPTTAATGSGTRCCARRCSPTCCRASGCGCTRAIAAYLAEHARRRARRPSGRTTPARATTCPAPSSASLEAAADACRVGAPAEQLQHLEARARAVVGGARRRGAGRPRPGGAAAGDRGGRAHGGGAAPRRRAAALGARDCSAPTPTRRRGRACTTRSPRRWCGSRTSPARTGRAPPRWRSCPPTRRRRCAPGRRPRTRG